MAKQLNQATHRLMVTAVDDEEADAEADRGSKRGFPVETRDPDNVGALLAAPTGGYPVRVRVGDIVEAGDAISAGNRRFGGAG